MQDSVSVPERGWGEKWRRGRRRLDKSIKEVGLEDCRGRRPSVLPQDVKPSGVDTGRLLKIFKSRVEIAMVNPW